MSLIEEALRKTQSQQSPPQAPVPSSAPKASTPLPTIGSPSPRAGIERVLMIGGAILIAGIVAWEAWVYLTPGGAPGKIARGSSRGAQVVPASFSPAHHPLMQPTLRLSGIVGGPGEPLAIINGAIVRVGEQVAGATLLEIGSDYAKVRWRDDDIVQRTGE